MGIFTGFFKNNSNKRDNSGKGAKINPNGQGNRVIDKSNVNVADLLTPLSTKLITYSTSGRSVVSFNYKSKVLDGSYLTYSYDFFHSISENSFGFFVTKCLREEPTKNQPEGVKDKLIDSYSRHVMLKEVNDAGYSVLYSSKNEDKLVTIQLGFNLLEITYKEPDIVSKVVFNGEELDINQGNKTKASTSSGTSPKSSSLSKSNVW